MVPPKNLADDTNKNKEGVVKKNGKIEAFSAPLFIHDCPADFWKEAAELNTTEKIIHQLLIEIQDISSLTHKRYLKMKKSYKWLRINIFAFAFSILFYVVLKLLSLGV
jgi:hypothetical protein